MTEHADKLSEDDKEPLGKAIEKVKTASATEDVGAIKQATDELDACAKAFSKVLYEKTAAAGGDAPDPTAAGAAAPAGDSDDDDAIDADFEVKS
jgi:molecular chaperone DnaK